MENTVISPGRELLIPSREEILATAKVFRLLFPAEEQITEDWIRLSYRYLELFGAWFLAKTGLDRLDRRVAERNYAPAAPEQKQFFQKYCPMGLQFFYLRCVARVERLSDEARQVLETAERDGTRPEDAWIKETFRQVMCADPDRPDTTLIPLVTLRNEYAVMGGEIPLGLRSVPRFTPEGELVSESDELQRLRSLTDLCRRAGPALGGDLGCPVRIAPELFLV